MNKDILVRYEVEEFDPEVGTWGTCEDFHTKEAAQYAMKRYRKAWESSGYSFRVVKITQETLE